MHDQHTLEFSRRLKILAKEFGLEYATGTYGNIFELPDSPLSCKMNFFDADNNVTITIENGDR